MSFTIQSPYWAFHHPRTVVKPKKTEEFGDGFHWKPCMLFPQMTRGWKQIPTFGIHACSAHQDGSRRTGKASKPLLNEGKNYDRTFTFSFQAAPRTVCMSTDWLLISWSTPSLRICTYFTCSLPARQSILWQRQCFIWLLLMCLCVHMRAYTLSNKDSMSHFWTAITVPLRKLSRWVWNMQQFVWSLRSPFRAAFACNYNRIGSVPCDWRILFMLRSNFLFLRGWEKAASCFFFLFVFFLMFSPRSYIQQRRTKITETWKSGSKTARLAKKRKLLDFIYLFVYEGKVIFWLIKDVWSQAPFQMSAKCWGRYVLRESQVLKLTLHIEPLDSSFSQKCPPVTLQIIYFSPQCHKLLLRSHILPIVMSSHATVSPFNSALQWSNLLCTVSKETKALFDQLHIWKMTTTQLHVVGKQLPIWRICHQMWMLFLLFVQSLINIVTFAFHEHVTYKVLESWIQSARTF